MAIFSFKGSGGVATGGVRLAPDLNWPANGTFSNTFPYIQTDSINASGGLTTLLSLTGKFSVSSLAVLSLTTSDDLTVKLTVDGIVIWNSTILSSSAETRVLYGSPYNASGSSETPFICNETLLLEVQTSTDTNISFRYSARPIL